MDAGGGRSQVQLVSDLRGNVLKRHRVPGDALETDAIQRQPWQLTHLHLPLHKGAPLAFAVRAEDEESLLFLVGDRVVVQYAAYLIHH